jgi:hypothetical protein
MTIKRFSYKEREGEMGRHSVLLLRPKEEGTIAFFSIEIPKIRIAFARIYSWRSIYLLPVIGLCFFLNDKKVMDCRLTSWFRAAVVVASDIPG